MQNQILTIPLCYDFIEQARDTWKKIEVSEQIGLPLKETTITDINLLELTSKNPYNVISKAYSPYREARNGADWEWWLGSGSIWIGLRVQAKKLYPNTMKYRNIDYSNKHGRQVENLINKALNATPPRIPIYVFYNYWDITQFNLPWLNH
ncbi:MAG: DUF6615 family protein [Candidatus Hodarchaeales archaeon]